MAEALLWTGAGFVAAGGLLSLIGALGVIRFPDVYTRTHAASITDTGGATLVILGLGLIGGFSIETVTLLLVWFFIILTGPVAAHALTNAAYSSGHTPWIGAFRIMRGEQKDGPTQ
jgi:multicomponent Na+:H+ antiporter subunit G